MLFGRSRKTETETESESESIPGHDLLECLEKAILCVTAILGWELGRWVLRVTDLMGLMGLE